MRRQVFRRIAINRSSQDKVKADGAAQHLRIAIGQHTVVETGGEQHQQSWLRRQIPMGLIEGMASRDRTAVAGRRSRHQLIRLGWGMDAQHPVLTATGSTQVEHSTEMGIGVVVTAHHLIPVAEHRPAALHVQSQLGLIEAPIRMLQTDFSIYMGMLLTYLPLMILPLYAVMIRLDDDLLDAAADLGASRVQVFRTIVLPLTFPGIIAGSLLVFIPAVGEFVIPALLGGPEQVMIGKVLWTEFFRNRDWPVASAIAMLLLAILALPIIYARYQDGRETALDRAEEAGRGGQA